MKKLMESFEAFVNHDLDKATRLYREYFIESAQAINADMDEQLDEEFGGDPEEDMADEIVAEAFGEEEPADEFGGEEEPDDEFGGEDESADEFGGEEDGVVEVPQDEWAELHDQFDQLEAMFAEMGGDAGEDDLAFDEPAEGDDEIVFGDEEDGLNEAFQMRAVKDPGMKSETQADNVKPIINKAAPKSIKVPAVAAGMAGDGTVKGSNTKMDCPDAETPKVEDHNNVMPNGKGAYKKTKKVAMPNKEDATAAKPTIKDMR